MSMIEIVRAKRTAWRSGWRGILNVAILLAVALPAARVSADDEAEIASEPAITSVRIGIVNHVKVAHWAQVQVDTNYLLPPQDTHFVVTAPDNDGVPTIATAPFALPRMPDGPSVGTVYTNVGRLGTPIQVALVAKDETVESRTLTAGATAANSGFVELPATAELLLFFGPMPQQLLDEFTSRSSANDELVRKAVRADSVYDLPEKWFGYDGVDLAVMTVGDGGPFDSYCTSFAADGPRFDAFVRWIELGGRLVIFCGGQNAKELLGDGRPLAKLLPGSLADVVRLPETGRLEHFAASEVPINAREAIAAPRLVDVEGKIELYEGRRPSDLPLVVRAPRGLGEVAFVAIDPTKAPFAAWPGRRTFVDAVLRPYLAGDNSANGSQTLVTRGYTDMSGALRQTLGRRFVGVAPIAFSLVTVMAVAYLLVLGPLDYFVIHKWIKQYWVAWITFLGIVMLFGGLAFALAERRQGGGTRRVNQVELVDIDVRSNQARGTVWSTVYSPAADQLDLRFEVELLSNESKQAETMLHSWALPGAGIGGTQSGGKSWAADEGYRYGDHYDELIGVPILTSGTKSLLARWTAPVGPLVQAELANEEGLVTGWIENRTGRTLRNGRLYYGEWGYRLGTIADGARIELGEELSPRSFRTIVTQDSFNAEKGSRPDAQVFVADRASLREILNVMMFYDAVGGFGFAQLQNRFQAYCDLSRLPLLGRAVLMADLETAGSRLVNAETGEALGDQNSAGVIYRFVLPVLNQGR